MIGVAVGSQNHKSSVSKSEQCSVASAGKVKKAEWIPPKDTWIAIDAVTQHKRDSEVKQAVRQSRATTWAGACCRASDQQRRMLPLEHRLEFQHSV